MSKKRSKRERRRARITHLPPGTAPGTLIPAPDAVQSKIDIIAYGPEGIVEEQIEDPDEVKKYIGKWPVVWVNVEGLGSADVVRKIGEIFSIHNLALEDVLNVHERAKIERFGDELFLVMHMMEVNDHLESEQMSVFSGKHFVVTFQEGPIDTLEPARERIRRGQGHIRQLGSDYLLYSIIDSVLDNYFPILEIYAEQLDKLEDEIISKPTTEVAGNVHLVKRELLTLRRSVWPLREAINSLIRDSEGSFSEETRIHLRIIDFIETYRELSADLMDVYLSSLSTRMNEVMKVLTIITTLFVPPTLIAGIYGMNFNTELSRYNMPELNWYYGYPFALILMLVVSLGVIALLWYKGWLPALGKRGNGI
jgi:magnesium transporter